MNPIHEAGFASLIVLAMGAAPAAFASVLAIVLSRWKPKAGLVFAGIGAVLSALVLLVAAVTTVKLHERIDYWIDTGGYGPSADVRRTYGPEWHSSARITATVGVFFTALPLLLSGLGYKRARAKNGWGVGAIVIGSIAGLSLLWCLAMCVV
ncbi:MAG: hypothetical protein QM820_23370 [Minicystis sp.]